VSDVDWNRRNMVIFAISISIGLPGCSWSRWAVQHLPDTPRFC